MGSPASHPGCALQHEDGAGEDQEDHDVDPGRPHRHALGQATAPDDARDGRGDEGDGQHQTRRARTGQHRCGARPEDRRRHDPQRGRTVPLGRWCHGRRHYRGGVSPPPRAPRSVVVVGAGLAGAGTVAALRAEGFAGRVTVLGDEGVPPYDRPPLSKELLSRTTPAWLADEIGADAAAADLLALDRPALGLALRPDGGTVTTAQGQVDADVVVVATGAHAVRPAGWGAARTLHTAADAAGLRRALRPGARLVVVGAGWVGAEVAGVAAAAGVHVTVVEGAHAPLATALGATVGAWTVPWYARAGVRLVAGRTVRTVQAVDIDGGAGAGTGRPEGVPGPHNTGSTTATVTLDDGEVLEADVVLAAVGARPSTGWLVGALPLGPDGSVAVDDAFRPVDVDAPVVVLGDAARRRSPRHGWVPGGHWDGALRGPAVAVRRLLGGAAAPHDDLTPYVFSTQLGHELALHGQPGPDDDVVVRGDVTGPVTALWFRTGTDVLTAVLAVDRPRDVAAARRLFSGPALPAVDREVAADPDRPLRDAVR